MENNILAKIIMIKNIEWPSGTKVNYGVPMPNDYYSDDFPWEILDFDFDRASSYITEGKTIAFKRFNSNNLKKLDSYCRNIDNSNVGVGPIFPINLSSMSKIDITSMPMEIVFEGDTGALVNVNEITLASQGKYTPTIWYPYDKDYLKIINKYPAYTYIQYGAFPVQVRILKDGEWCDGSETVTYNFQNMDYIGNGIYELYMEVEPRGRYMFPIEVDGYRKSVQASSTTQIITLGDMGDAAVTITGEEIMDIIVENPNGWYYDSAVGGVRNNKITHSQKTQIKIEVPTNEITVTYGQDSEKSYDYCIIYDGNMTPITDRKGFQGDNLQMTLTSPTNSFIFEYKKDGSGDQGKDAFWIKSIEYFSLPPFPEN